jgi:hypothetical protein
LHPTPIKAPTTSIGISPEDLLASITTEACLSLNNQSQHPYADLKLTVSYFNSDAAYLDFEDIELESLASGRQRVMSLVLTPPEETASATIDISGQKQTFLKRHWKLISTVVALTWGFIIVARRLTP